MKRKFPALVQLDADEVDRVNRIRVAQWYQISPREVDEMSVEDYETTMEIMWADAQK
jgi:hypothetical protein